MNVAILFINMIVHFCLIWMVLDTELSLCSFEIQMDSKLSGDKCLIHGGAEIYQVVDRACMNPLPSVFERPPNSQFVQWGLDCCGLQSFKCVEGASCWLSIAHCCKYVVTACRQNDSFWALLGFCMQFWVGVITLMALDLAFVFRWSAQQQLKTAFLVAACVFNSSCVQVAAISTACGNGHNSCIGPFA